MKTKKKPKYGKVILNIGYVVDLSDKDMIEHAKDCVFEDVENAIKYNQIYDNIIVIKDDRLKESDIPSFLLDEDE
jgi:hypothetical protein